MKPIVCKGGRHGGRCLHVLPFLLATAMLFFAESTPAASEQVPPGSFAVIDGVAIPESAFESYFRNFVRSRYYHGATAEQLAGLRPEAAESFVANHLLLREAERRGLPSDSEEVDRQIAAIEARYGGTDSWQAIEAKLPEIRERLLEASKVKALETAVKAIPEPQPAVLERFYQDNIQLFTQPRQVHLAVILVGIEPEAFAEERQEAEKRAEVLFQRLKSGADFAELANEMSTLDSVGNGGDMGFLHLGALAPAAQQAVDRLSPGEFTGPVLVLEGYALFKLIERRPEQVQPLAAVRERALSLYRRQQAQETWDRFVAALREKADVKINLGEGARRSQND